MKPALDTVVAKIRGGGVPTAREYRELLDETGCPPAEARGLAIEYQKATAGLPSASETAFMNELRGFALRHE